MKLLRYTIFTLFILASFCNAQNNIDEWGLGIISNYNNANKSEIINFPIATLNIYDKPSGNAIGKISKDEEYAHHYYNVEVKLHNAKNVLKVIKDDLREISYEGTCLKFYKVKENYIQILIHSLPNGVWIKIEDLHNFKFYPVSWKEFLLSKKTGFFPKREGGINLRESPSLSSKVIVEMHGDLYNIDLTGKNIHNWFEVKVLKYDQHPCTGKYKILKELTGWIKTIDKKNHPKIWFYTRGC